MGDKEYTLDELVRLTGFSKRQIRYYITEKLIPGAGEQGPHAAYDEETLQRLEMIKVFKAQRMGPTGRTMTLAEIRHSLDNMPGPQSSMVASPEDVSFPLGGEMPDFLLEQDYSASSYLEDIEDKKLSLNEPSFSLSRPMISGDQACNIPAFSDPVDENPLEDLMRSLHSLLVDLGSDTRFESQTSEGDSWRRITSPDVEIQVRTPDTMEARKRLLQMALQISHLLAREE